MADLAAMIVCQLGLGPIPTWINIYISYTLNLLLWLPASGSYLSPIHMGLVLFSFYHLWAPLPTAISTQSWVTPVLLTQIMLSSEPETFPLLPEVTRTHKIEIQQ